MPLSWQPIDLRGQLPTRPNARAYYPRDLTGVIGATVHYSASPPRSGREAVEAIARYQVGPTAQEDFPAIAYHIVVDASGDVYLCHSLDVRVWHSGAVVNGVKRNASHVGICIIDNDTPGSETIKGVARAVVWCERQLSRQLEIEGHKDADNYPTRCPGDNWQAWKPGLLEEVAALRG